MEQIRSDIDAINRYYEQPIIESNLRSGYHIRDEIDAYIATAQKFIIPQTLKKDVCILYVCYCLRKKN